VEMSLLLKNSLRIGCFSLICTGVTALNICDHVVTSAKLTLLQSVVTAGDSFSVNNVGYYPV
jgi:hypothetical protein